MNFDHLNTTADWPNDPIALFTEWFAYANAEEVPEPEAMTICSATPDGKPSGRIVLLRGIDEEGFHFYTNYESRKGKELIANPHAAIVFYWHKVYLQIRIEGDVTKASVEKSDRYFDARPRANRASAVVSPQSRTITDFRDLARAADELLATDDPVKRPDHWGGFLIQPTVMEFWAGTQTRMHRRCVYSRTDEDWTRELIAP